MTAAFFLFIIKFLCALRGDVLAFFSVLIQSELPSISESLTDEKKPSMVA